MNPTHELVKYLDEQASVVILEVAAQGEIVKANKYACHLSGKELAGTHLSEFFTTFNAELNITELLSHATTRKLLNINTFHSLPQTLYFTSLPGPETTLLIGEASSLEVEELRNTMVTLNNELNNLTRELQKKNIQLDQLNKMKNQFLGMAAHDLRNPISTILMFSEFVLEENSDCVSPECRQIMEIIKNSSRFMLNMLDELLDVVKIEAGKLELRYEDLELDEFLARNIRLNAMFAARKQIRIVKNVLEDIPAIQADPGKLEQVMNNLLSNAIKYSGSGTTVTVNAFRTRDEVVVSVADQGQGIPKEEMDLLFQPFAKLSPKGTAGEKSTGLGLNIVKRIVIGHMGRIWVESTLGKGTVFYFSLPLTPPNTKPND